jgi:HlyD family secretion protein
MHPLAACRHHLVAGVLLAAVPGIPTCGPPQQAKPTPDAAASASRVVGALGRVEPARGVVHVGAVPGERIERLLVGVGDAIAPDTELARLTGAELRRVEHEVACAQLAEARDRSKAQRVAAAAALAEAEVAMGQAEAPNLEAVAQQARVDAAEAAAATARRDLERLTGLEARLIPEQALDRRRLLAAQADLDVRAQRALLERMNQARQLARSSAAAALETARANVALADAGGSLVALEKAVEAARLRRDMSLVRSPAAGRVLEILAREGEIVGPTPILLMADVSAMQVIAEVYETDVQRIQVGQRAEARSRAIPRVLTGRVVTIGGMVSPNEVQGLGMPATAEQRVVKVRIALDDPAAAADFVNLQVDVDFLAVTDERPAVPQ